MRCPLEFSDNVPVIELPDGRRALIDTGCSTFEAVTQGQGSMVDLRHRELCAVNPGLDLCTNRGIPFPGWTS